MIKCHGCGKRILLEPLSEWKGKVYHTRCLSLQLDKESVEKVSVELKKGDILYTCGCIFRGKKRIYFNPDYNCPYHIPKRKC